LTKYDDRCQEACQEVIDGFLAKTGLDLILS